MSANLDTVLRELESASLIHGAFEPEPVFTFKHVLVQETGYQSLLNKDRRELHLLVAAAFEQAYGDHLDAHVPALALHYLAGEDWAKAAYYARRAGERALRVYALREAKGYFERARQALERMPDAAGEDLCDAILGWTEAAFGFEPFPNLLEQLRRAESLARQHGDKRHLAHILHSIGKVYIASGHARTALTSLVECFALVTELGDERLAMFPTYYMGHAKVDGAPREAVEWFSRAVELGRKFGDVDIQAYALSSKAMVQANLGDRDGAHESLAQAFHLIPRIQSPMCDSDMHLFAAMAYLGMDEVPNAIEFARVGVEKANSADNMECACFGYACLGFGEMRAEQIGEATLAFQEAIRRSRISGAEQSEILGEAGLGMAQFISGDAGAVRQLEGALAHAQRAGEQQISAMLSQNLGEVYLRQGNVERSLASLNAALAYYRRHMMRPDLSRTLELVADAFERLNESDKAAAVRVERDAVLNTPAASVSAAD